jgi:hypothetical protein
VLACAVVPACAAVLAGAARVCAAVEPEAP